MYYYVSKDDLNTYVEKAPMHSVEELFKPLNITFLSGYDKLHIITKYATGEPKKKVVDNILFFFDNLIFQVCRSLLVAEQIFNETSNTEDYKLYFRVNREDFEITQYSNCLFIPHYICKPEPPKVIKFPFDNLNSLDNRDKKEFIQNLNEPTKSPESENGRNLVVPSLSFLFLMFSFLTGLLLFKSSGRLFGGKAAETQLEPSNLVDKSDDLKLNELKHESTTSFGSLNKTQNDSQLNSSISKSTIQSSQLDSPSTESANVIATELPNNQTKK